MFAVDENRTYKISGDGSRDLIANFAAQITQEVRHVDGMSTDTLLTITGQMPGPTPKAKPIPLPPVEVNADQFGSMQWVLRAWGTRAVIQPGGTNKEELRVAIQMSSNPTVSTVFRHIGWTRIDKKLTYLHAKGGITANGDDATIQVALPPELARYDLSKAVTPAAGVKATLSLLEIGPPEIMWPLLAATFAPLYGQVDFALHVTGRTGTFKSEVLSLAQSHYGASMDARHLPGSWSSTGNALEAQAFLAKNAPMVIDDFVPSGTTWNQRAYQQNADKIIRAQGNQAGRARLTDTSNLQATMYPRGIVLSTGEDTPEGHSVRARMLILELSPGDIKIDALSRAQKQRDQMTGTTVGIIQSLAGKPIDIRPAAAAIRDQNLEIGHSRTPSMIGHLIAVIGRVLTWAAEKGGLEKRKAVQLEKQAEEAIMQAGANQLQYLEAADPVEVFQGAIRQILGALQGHVRTIAGGVPHRATMLGWTNDSANEQMPYYKSHGACIGWIDWDTNELFIDMAAGFQQVRKAAGADMVLTRQTLLKRLKDSGELTRTDDLRQRNTVRLRAEGHARTVIAMNLLNTLKQEEGTNEEAN